MDGTREAIVGGEMVVDDEILCGHAVLVADGRIVAVVREGEIPVDFPHRRLDGGILAPGFIDIHTHGGGGHGFSAGDPAGFRHALQVHLAAGVTTVLPTLVSAPIDEISRALEIVAGMADRPDLPRVPGAHLEGPYFARAQCGAQDPDALRTPDDGSVDCLLEHASSIRMVSFAPELPGAVTLTERLVAQGIVAAAGHTDGRDTDLAACARAGLSHVIHIVSGQSTTVRDGPWRRPGMLEATLASDDLTVEMIADGKHLPDTLMRMAFRCLAGRLCLVSDSTPGAGLPDGSRYALGGNEYVVEDGVGMTLDRSAFAGSVTLVPRMLALARAALDISLPEAVAMVTSIPAAAAHLTRLGRIAPGYHADFVVLDSELNTKAVALAGRWRQRPHHTDRQETH